MTYLSVSENVRGLEEEESNTYGEAITTAMEATRFVVFDYRDQRTI